jgi:ParB-like chromosome segregation protein Spo0J
VSKEAQLERAVQKANRRERAAQRHLHDVRAELRSQLLLMRQHGYSVRQLAALVGRSPSTVQKLIREAEA